MGRTAGWKLCTLPSVETKVPAVSVNGAIGSSTCAYSLAACAERGERDDELRLAQRAERGVRIGAIELGLGIQQHVGALRLVEHRMGVFADRQAGDVTADRVRRLAEHAELRAERTRRAAAPPGGSARRPGAAARSCRAGSRRPCPT
jgi:hypothetical protein